MVLSVLDACISYAYILALLIYAVYVVGREGRIAEVSMASFGEYERGELAKGLSDWSYSRVEEPEQRHYAEKHTHVFCLEFGSSLVIRWCACGRAEVLREASGHRYQWELVEEPGETQTAGAWSER